MGDPQPTHSSIHFQLDVRPLPPSGTLFCQHLSRCYVKNHRYKALIDHLTCLFPCPYST